MSNFTRTVEQDCNVKQACNAIKLIIEPKATDLGGLPVRRLLPTTRCRKVGPWVFLDHMGPAGFRAGEGINVKPHPHINLATVTYLFEGEILHRDSLGSKQAIRPGDVNLMVAGSGIVHSERERPEITKQAHKLDGLQLWLALPEADEETEPAFYHYPVDLIPERNIDGVSVRVIMGAAFGVRSPVKTFAETLYVEARLRAGQSLVLPEADERAVYIINGSLNAKGALIPEHCLAVFESEAGIQLRAESDTRIVIIGGQAIDKRHMDWNFVSLRKERITLAREDWKYGRFPKVPGDAEEFIPLPE